MKYYMNPQTEKDINLLGELVKPFMYIKYQRAVDSLSNAMEKIKILEREFVLEFIKRNPK